MVVSGGKVKLASANGFKINDSIFEHNLHYQ